MWRAEAAWLRHLAAGLPPPWWEAALAVRPAGLLGVLAGWIARDPGRAAVLLPELMQSVPDLPAQLSPRAADQLAAALAARLRAAFPAAWLAEEQLPTLPPASLLPPALARALAGIAADRRAPFMLAALVAHAPAWTPVLARVAAADLAALAPPDAVAVADTVADRPTAGRRGEAAGVAVLQGGLLLLLRRWPNPAC